MRDADELKRLAHEMGKMGAAPTEFDRLSFEAWMCGHCWEVSGEWTGVSYSHPEESGPLIHNAAMVTRMLFAAWRDRGALDRQLAERAASSKKYFSLGIQEAQR